MAYIAKITDTSNVTGFITASLYGTCDTAAATAAKVVSCTDFDKLIVGATIRVRFDNINSADNPTLNVNSTGAKTIVVAGTFASPTKPLKTDITSWYAGEVVEFIYLENTVSGTTTGYWFMTNSHAVLTTTSVGSATAGTAIKINNPTLGTATTASKATTAASISASLITTEEKTATNTVLGTATTASKATNASDISASLIVTEDVTLIPVTAVTPGTACSATISEGVLTLSANTPTALTTGASTTIKSVKTNTSKTIKQWTFADVSVPVITSNTSVTAVSVKTNTSKTINQWTFADVSVPAISTTEVSIPNISVSSKTVVAKR